MRPFGTVEIAERCLFAAQVFLSMKSIEALATCLATPYVAARLC